MTSKDIELLQEIIKNNRYGVKWEGDIKKPIHEKMTDGYWVPWHLVDLLLASYKDEYSKQIDNI